MQTRILVPTMILMLLILSHATVMVDAVLECDYNKMYADFPNYYWGRIYLDRYGSVTIIINKPYNNRWFYEPFNYTYVEHLKPSRDGGIDVHIVSYWNIGWVSIGPNTTSKGALLINETFHEEYSYDDGKGGIYEAVVISDTAGTTYHAKTLCGPITSGVMECRTILYTKYLPGLSMDEYDREASGNAEYVAERLLLDPVTEPTASRIRYEYTGDKYIADYKVFIPNNTLRYTSLMFNRTAYRVIWENEAREIYSTRLTAAYHIPPSTIREIDETFEKWYESLVMVLKNNYTTYYEEFCDYCRTMNDTEVELTDEIYRAILYPDSWNVAVEDPFIYYALIKALEENITDEVIISLNNTFEKIPIAPDPFIEDMHAFVENATRVKTVISFRVTGWRTPEEMIQKLLGFLATATGHRCEDALRDPTKVYEEIDNWIVRKYALGPFVYPVSYMHLFNITLITPFLTDTMRKICMVEANPRIRAVVIRGDKCIVPNLETTLYGLEEIYRLLYYTLHPEKYFTPDTVTDIYATETPFPISTPQHGGAPPTHTSPAQKAPLPAPTLESSTTWYIVVVVVIAVAVAVAVLWRRK